MVMWISPGEGLQPTPVVLLYICLSSLYTRLVTIKDDGVLFCSRSGVFLTLTSDLCTDVVSDIFTARCNAERGYTDAFLVFAVNLYAVIVFQCD